MNILQLAVLIMTIVLGLYVIISHQFNYSNDLVFLPLLISTIGLFVYYVWKKKQKH